MSEFTGSYYSSHTLTHHDNSATNDGTHVMRSSPSFTSLYSMCFSNESVLRVGPIVIGRAKSPGSFVTVVVPHLIVKLECCVGSRVTSAFVTTVLAARGAIELSEPSPTPIYFGSPPSHVAPLLRSVIITNSPGTAGTPLGGSTETVVPNPTLSTWMYVGLHSPVSGTGSVPSSTPPASP